MEFLNKFLQYVRELIGKKEVKEKPKKKVKKTPKTGTKGLIKKKKK
jgi:hypothetical protein